MEYFSLKPFRTKPYKELISNDEIPKFIPEEKYIYSERLHECDPNIAMSYLHLNINASKQQLDRIIFRTLSKKQERLEWLEKKKEAVGNFKENNPLEITVSFE